MRAREIRKEEGNFVIFEPNSGLIDGGINLQIYI